MRIFSNSLTKYLPLYIAEFQFRYNNPCNDDIFKTAIGECQWTAFQTR